MCQYDNRLIPYNIEICLHHFTKTLNKNKTSKLDITVSHIDLSANIILVHFTRVAYLIFPSNIMKIVLKEEKYVHDVKTNRRINIRRVRPPREPECTRNNINMFYVGIM